MTSISPALQPYVASLVAYDVDLGAPGVHRGLPSTTVTFVLPIGEPLDVAWAGVPGSRRSGWSSLSGLHGQPAEIHHTGRQTGLQLALTPAGARALLGLPAAAMAGELMELDELGGRAGAHLRSLPERLHEVASWPERLRLLEQTLIRGLAATGAPRPRAEVGRALARLAGRSSVAAVADDVGLSRRHLTTVFRAECGLSPKEFQRIARFQRSRDLMVHAAGRGRLSLAAVAGECGYADQPHLSREWTRLAGCPPATWLNTELPFFQDLAPGDEAG